MFNMRMLGIVGMVLGVVVGGAGITLGILDATGVARCRFHSFLPLVISLSLSSVALYLGGIMLMCKNSKAGA